MIKRGPEDLQNIPWQSKEPLGGDVGPGWDLSARLFVIIIPLSPGNGAGAQIPRKQRAQRARNETGRVLGWVKGRILLPRSAQGAMSSPQGQRGHQKKKKTSPQIPGQGHFPAGNSSQPAVPQSLSSPGSRLDFISVFIIKKIKHSHPTRKTLRNADSSSRRGRDAAPAAGGNRHLNQPSNQPSNYFDF